MWMWNQCDQCVYVLRQCYNKQNTYIYIYIYCIYIYIKLDNRITINVNLMLICIEWSKMSLFIVNIP